MELKNKLSKKVAFKEIKKLESILVKKITLEGSHPSTTLFERVMGVDKYVSRRCSLEQMEEELSSCIGEIKRICEEYDLKDYSKSLKKKVNKKLYRDALKREEYLWAARFANEFN